MPPTAQPACLDQDERASWAPTPGSDLALIGHPSRSTLSTRVSPDSPPSLPLPRTRHILAARLRVHMPAALLNGTARGNECVSRTWGSRQPSHPNATNVRWTRWESLYRCLVQSASVTETPK